MEITLKEITIKELFEGYKDSYEEGVIGYGGKLNIRPKYQREFIYKDKQRNAVIDTVLKNFPLNVMYWVVCDDGSFELLDGQQRTISICSYLKNEFSVYFNNGPKTYENFEKEELEQINNYKLMVYFCKGTDREKLEWFKTINIAGEKLTNQELRNAVYTGTWLTDAKKFFSKTGCPAYNIGKDYINGTPIRQDYLEKIIYWFSNDNIEKYMSENQRKPNANELRLYFENLMSWVKTVFPKYRKEMKGLDWGFLYNKYKDTHLDSKKLEQEISELMLDEDVTKKSGIYEYVLTRQQKSLNIRIFSDKQKRETYEKQKGICIKCEKKFQIIEMHADHIIPWSKGGKTTSENCQMLCQKCNGTKSNK
jgi:hypothetical protein